MRILDNMGKWWNDGRKELRDRKERVDERIILSRMWRG
jgi:hypothetical protein